MAARTMSHRHGERGHGSLSHRRLGCRRADASVAVRCRPLAGAGEPDAEGNNAAVALDYVEVRLRY